MSKILWFGTKEKVNGEKRWSLTLEHEYTSFLPNQNWRNFTFINLYVEISPYRGKGAFEVAFTLLGVTLELRNWGEE